MILIHDLPFRESFLSTKSTTSIVGISLLSTFTLWKIQQSGELLRRTTFSVKKNLKKNRGSLYNKSHRFAPYLGKIYAIAYSAYADDLAIFCRNLNNIEMIRDLLLLFETATGLKVNHSKTEIHHIDCFESSICTWPVVRTIKILGILFPTKSRTQINEVITKLHGQISFWKTLKLSLYTMLELLNSYNKLQYVLPILDWNATDVKRVNKLISWADLCSRLLVRCYLLNSLGSRLIYA